jgi:hypothetical protein
VGTAPPAPQFWGEMRLWLGWVCSFCAALFAARPGALLQREFAGRLNDALNNAVEIRHDFPVSEAQHAVTIAFQVFSACLILLALLLVDRAIDFDHEFGRRAEEVKDKWSDRVLATKS